MLSDQTSPTIVTPLPMVPPAAPTLIVVQASIQVVSDDDPLKKKFQHSIKDFLHLLR